MVGLECITRAEADIVLLVDGSWSIGRPNFRTVRSFIGRIVEVFDIGPDKVQIGKFESTRIDGVGFLLVCFRIFYN